MLSPADGRVLVAGTALPGAAPEGEWQQISIFLSPMDVHVNRVPAAGMITRVLYRPGRFLVASRKEAATENEDLKIKILKDICAKLRPQALVATNTSSISVFHSGEKGAIPRAASEL